MKTAIKQFKLNILRVRNFESIYSMLNARVTSVLDVTDILRAEYVLAISALDFYMHEVVRLGMIEIIQGKRAETNAFKKFNVCLESVRQAINDPLSFDWLEGEIRTRHGFKSFQQAKKVAEALKLISEIPVWDEVSNKMGTSAKDIRDRLDLIVDRRNKIAHEADIDPSYPDTRWPIDEQLVSDTVGFIEQVVEFVDSSL